MPSIGWSNFARERHQQGTGNSFFTISHEEVLNRVYAGFDCRVPGTGETGIDRKVLVAVDPKGFFLSSVDLQEGLPLRAEVVRRQPHEDPYVEIYVPAEEAKRLGIRPQSAKYCNIVLYSKEALLENNGERSTDCDWEIVSVNAFISEQDHMPPLTMARNMLEKAGGTKSVYTAEEFAEAIYAHSLRGVKVKSSSPDYSKLSVEQIKKKAEQLRAFEQSTRRYLGDICRMQQELTTVCKHEWKKGDSAVCKICGGDFGWSCEESPDGVCHYMNEASSDGYVDLLNGATVRAKNEYGGEYCVFCGNPDERK